MSAESPGAISLPPDRTVLAKWPERFLLAPGGITRPHQNSLRSYSSSSSHFRITERGQTPALAAASGTGGSTPGRRAKLGPDTRVAAYRECRGGAGRRGGPGGRQIPAAPKRGCGRIEAAAYRRQMLEPLPADESGRRRVPLPCEYAGRGTPRRPAALVGSSHAPSLPVCRDVCFLGRGRPWPRKLASCSHGACGHAGRRSAALGRHRPSEAPIRPSGAPARPSGAPNRPSGDYRNRRCGTEWRCGARPV